MQVVGEFFANMAKCFQQCQEIKTAVMKKLRADQIPGLLVTIQFTFLRFSNKLHKKVMFKPQKL
jgi:hypothetical protein